MKLDPKKILSTKPRYFRSTTSYADPGNLAVGDSSNTGTIQNVSLIARGEALGHDIWIDTQFLAQTYAAVGNAKNGIKSRFTHPSMSSDGLGTFVGRVSNAKIADDQVIGDLQFANAGRISPGKGDLVAYISQLAAEAPDAFGMSIVFESDPVAEKAFFIQHGGEVISDPELGDYFDNTDFVSPDPLNTRGLPHARLADLQAVDFVDSPACNPDGLFHREENLLSEANTLAAYALGLADHKPQLVQLAEQFDPDRVRGFVARFLHTNHLEVRKMADATSEIVADEVIEAPVAEVATDETIVEPVAEVTEVAAEEVQVVAASADRAEAQKFKAAFGQQGLAFWADGLSFEAAREKQVSELQKQVADLTAKLATSTKVAEFFAGEEKPVKFDTAEKTKGQGLAAKIRFAGKH